ncbi:hypothetical protein QR685DRAFT_465870 [Neurospora intermedia]|uniref:Uncharacterized protein n=1 Tax=Neurospora intermedia TaxID=5142 RepID=A0ABR3DRH5_NEUIN
MLLTSAQVSIAFSSGIVFIFTAALFLSGYAIQQRTLRDLRAAIKPTPRPSPRTYLPDQFKKITTELPDGTIVPVRDDGVVIEIKPTPPSEVHQTSKTEDENRQKPIPAPQPTQESATENTEMKKTSSARAKKYREQQQLKKQQQQQQQQQHMHQEGFVVQQGQQQQEQDFSKTPNQAEQQDTSGSTPIEIPEGMLEHPDPDKRAEKAVSPAERRSLIKEEIKRLAQPEERGYYQRRLW